MVKEAEEQAEADRQKRESADLHNEASNLIFQTNKALDDLKDEVDEATKEKIKSEITALEEALKGEDLELIKERKTTLEKDAQDIAMKAYQKAQAAEQPSEEQQSDDNQTNGKTTVDAEFEEKN